MSSILRSIGFVILLLMQMPLAAADTAEATPSVQAVDSTQRPEVVKVGLYLLSVYDLNHGADSYLLDFYIWFNWTGATDPTKTFEFINMVDNSSATIERIGEEPDILKDGSKYQIFRVEGRFVEPSNFQDYPFDRQYLTVEIEDSTFGVKNRVYEIDAANSRVDSEVWIPGWELVGLQSDNRSKSYDSKFGSDSEPSVYSRANFTLSVQRPPSVFYWKLFLPLAFILVAALAALILPPEDIDSRSALIGGGLLTTVFLQKTYSDLLPDIDYLVLMDKIYILAYLAIVLALVRVVYSYIKARQLDESAEVAILRVDRALFMGLLLSFFLATTLLVVLR